MIYSKYTSLDYFNSIKVRLEHLINEKQLVVSKFQFHKGTIRTTYHNALKTIKHKFHKGTIRTHRERRPHHTLLIFQFHKGTIRTISTRRCASGRSVFQFHKGTIRTLRQGQTYCKISYFNSIKVRLEPAISSSSIDVPWFQFHKGTIRTHLHEDAESNWSYFNSIKVRLEPIEAKT